MFGNKVYFRILVLPLIDPYSLVEVIELTSTNTCTTLHTQKNSGSNLYTTQCLKSKKNSWSVSSFKSQNLYVSKMKS